MKKIRIVAVLLIAVMLLSLPAFAAPSKGMSFTADAKYTASKKFEKAPVTFEAWINLPATVTGRGGVILGNWNGASQNVNFEIYENGVPRFYIENNGNFNHLFNNVHVNTGEWLHLAIVFNASQSTAKCYVNGQLKQSVKSECTTPVEVKVPMRLGGDYRPANEQYFKGQIASVAVYSDERTAAEIALDMNGYGKEGLIASYELSGASGNKISDTSGNGYDMTNPVVWIDADDMDALPEFAYSFAVVGDTQRIAYNYKNDFAGIYDWILENAEANKTKFVMGLGDITETMSGSDEEWTVAMDAITRLDGEIPYSLVRGNHDPVDYFNKYVKMDDYKDVIAGSHESNMLNTYHKFSVGDVKYMVFALDYGASNKVLAWAKDIIDSNPDYNVILTTHAYLYRDGTTLDADDVCPPATTGGKNNGDHIWDKLASQCENIVLVLSGHDPCDNIIMTQEKGVKGNTVTQMLIDPQGADNTYNGVGAVAMLYFSEDGKDVTVRYYSTIKDKYFMSDSQFSMTLDVVGDEEDNDGNQSNNSNNNNENNSGSNENENNGGADNGSNSDATDGTKPEGTTGTTQTTAAPERGGCGSVMSVSAVGVAALAALGACFVPKKKRR